MKQVSSINGQGLRDMFAAATGGDKGTQYASLPAVMKIDKQPGQTKLDGLEIRNVSPKLPTVTERTVTVTHFRSPP
ncbi:hypothetical protein CH330_08455 [candidate division WOR-3 bacterium JGI_Cruoil_03_51_56]|uniref:Uncharacterized protein n=1 Tax=candidate division WOR-3 bacterium JGI_Cruoil_03_51_56 TaxID=1973747 RepID=A0A235BPT5_UNCW3|nr:MAG: hypothetical protein CH330_08455 [candidate division WOR-3 bacterium JGI_Cruoil_03_51_56]